MGALLRDVAEHEAAHAVVAVCLGVRVVEVRIGADGGFTLHEGAATATDAATITAAGDAWQRHLSTRPYRDLACSDLAVFEREHGLDRLWRAQRAARQILTTRQADVHRLADKLTSARVVRLP